MPIPQPPAAVPPAGHCDLWQQTVAALIAETAATRVEQMPLAAPEG